LGIDISDRRISVALVEKTEQGIGVVAAATGDLPAGEAKPQSASAGKVLSQVLRTLGRRATARGIRTAVAVSAGPTIMRLLDLPKQMPMNISEFVGNELKQYVALSGRRVSSDFCGVGAGSGATRRLLAVAADAGAVGETLGTCRAAGVAVESVEPAALAYARAFLAGEKDIRRGHALLAMLSGCNLVMCLFRKGTLDFVRTREIPVGTDTPGVLRAWLAEELNAVLKYYRTDVPTESDGWHVRVVVHGSAHQKADIEPLHGIEPWIDSLTVVDSCEPAAALSGSAGASGTAPSAVAVGAALRLLDTSENDLRIALTTQEAVQARSREHSMLVAANVAALIIIGIFLIVQLLVRTTSAMDRRIQQARLDGQLCTASAMVVQDRYVDEEITRIRSRLAALRAVRTRRDVDWPAMLRSVGQAAPPGTCITHVAHGEGRTMLLTGTAPSREQVKRMMQNLEGGGVFGSVWMTHIQRPQDNDHVLEFEISCIMKAVD
jgi:Tfp pilus assembly protein PilN